MALSTTIVLTIAAALGKQMLNKWLGSSWESQVSQDLLELIRDSAIAGGKDKGQAKRIDEVAASVVSQLDPWVKVELPKLDSGERRAALEQAGFALISTRVSSNLLVEKGLNAKQFNQFLLDSRPDATKGLSELASAFYKRLIGESAQVIVAHAAEMPGFDVAVGSQLIADLGETRDNTKQILKHQQQDDEKEDKTTREFEQGFLRAVLKRFDRMELFGLPRMDDFSRRQSLTIAHINLSLAPTLRNAFSSFVLASLVDSSSLIKFDDREDSTDNREMDLPPELPDDFEMCEPIEMPTERYYTPSAWTSHSSSLIEDLLLHRPRGTSGGRVVIRGKAGSGKTTLLQWFAVTAARRQLEDSSRLGIRLIPFFIRLREFADLGFPGLNELPIVTAHMAGAAAPSGWLYRHLQQGTAILLIDGVDEVPTHVRQKMFERLQELVAAYPAATYVVTSRPAAVSEEYWPEWSRWIQEDKVTVLDLLDMSPVQVEQLIDQWHEALANSYNSEEQSREVLALPARLKQRLALRPDLRQITVNPLLCAMICAVHHDRRQNLPAERARLYHDCVDILLNRRDPGREIRLGDDYPELGEMQKERLVQSIAYWFLKNGYSDVAFEDADRHFDSVLAHMDMRNCTGSDVRRYMLDRTNLLRDPVKGRVDFAHRTFQEYLAAIAAVDANDFGLLLANARDDQWRETIILSMGVARPKERSSFLRKLVRKADALKILDHRHQLYLLAAACLETCVELDAEVRQLVIDRVALVLPPSNSDEVQIVAKAGDPITELLSPNQDYSGDEVVRCIEALAAIGSDHALNKIAEYCTDRRSPVCTAIGKAWSMFDRATYLKTVLGRCSFVVLSEMPSPDEVGKLELADSIEVTSRSIIDIEGLANLKQLRHINLSGTKVADLGALAHLHEISSLNISWTLVEDLSPLANLRSLSSLDMEHTKVKTLLPLVNLSKLESLQMGLCEVTELTLLTKMAALQTLKVTMSQLELPGWTQTEARIKNLRIYVDRPELVVR